MLQTQTFHPDGCIVEVSAEKLEALQDRCTDLLQIFGFGSDYEPTPEGLLLEGLIDKFGSA